LTLGKSWLRKITLTLWLECPLARHTYNIKTSLYGVLSYLLLSSSLLSRHCSAWAEVRMECLTVNLLTSGCSLHLLVTSPGNYHLILDALLFHNKCCRVHDWQHLHLPFVSENTRGFWKNLSSLVNWLLQLIAVMLPVLSAFCYYNRTPETG
jgi:hypothetical protein